MTQLSARAQTALEILTAGGAFRYGLETNGFTHREQFQWRLRSAGGSNVKGIGGATFRELENAGYSFTREASGFTGSAAYYHLRAA